MDARRALPSVDGLLRHPALELPGLTEPPQIGRDNRRQGMRRDAQTAKRLAHQLHLANKFVVEVFCRGVRSQRRFQGQCCTSDVTTLGHKQAGDLVNLEVDVTAKYVERLLAWKASAS